MSKLTINNKTYPATLRLYDEDKLIHKSDIGSFKDTCKDVIDDLEMDIFEKTYLNKAIYLFQALELEIEDK